MADTNIYYGSGIGVAGNIDIGAIGLSADSRLVVKTSAGLDELTAAKRIYDGMIVYCEADQTYHKCRVVWDNAFNIVSCSWTEVVIESKEELESIIAHATTAAMEFKGAIATLPNNPARGDMYKVAGENINITIDGVAAKIGDSIVYNGTQWFLIPSGDDIESNTTYEFEGKENSSEVHFKVKPSDSTEEIIYLDAYSQKEVDTKLNDYITSKSIEETYATKSEVGEKQDKLIDGVNILTINGETILQPGNIQIGEGGPVLTVNPDWNQNDETKIDYIKNRTHYKYEGKDIIIAENVLLTAVGDYQFESTSHPVDDALLYEGAEVVLTFADNTCGATLYYDSVTNEYYCGEGIWIGESDVTYTLTLASNYIRFECVYSGFYGETELPISIKIKSNETVYVPLDEKFMPDTIARKSEINELASGKVDKEEGKGLSTNDFTDEEKNKLTSIESGAEVNVQSDWDQNDETSSDYIKNRTHYEYIESSEIYSVEDEPVSSFVNEEELPLAGYSLTIPIGGADLQLQPNDIVYMNGNSFVVQDNYSNQISCGSIEENKLRLWSSNNEPGIYLDINGDVIGYGDPTGESGWTWTLDDYYLTISITRNIDVIRQLDDKFISEDIKRFGVGVKSFIANDTCQATKNYSFSEGLKTTASGDSSHAEGSETTAKGRTSHAEGSGTIANGIAAHAEGARAQANGAVSHAEGIDTIANGQYQHVQGKYNIADVENKYAHIVGNGSVTTNEETDEVIQNRSNAHTLDWDGNAWYAGEVAAASIKIGNTVFTEEQLMKILKFIETINVGGNN